MSARRSNHAEVSFADQLRSIKDVMDREGVSANDHSATELVFPPLLSADEIQVPGDDPSPVAEITPPQLRSNHAHWVEFEQLIERGEYAAAATVVEYLDSDASLKASLNGLYVKAQIVIKRGRLEYVQAQSQAAKLADDKSHADTQVATQLQADQRQQEVRQLEAARKRSIGYWLGRALASIKQHPGLAGPGFATIVMLAMTGFGKGF